MSKELPFIEKSPPPPDVEEGDVLKANIETFKREKGEYGEQICFNLSFADGYKTKAWISFYDRPSERSKLGKILIKLHEKTGVAYQNIQQALDGLRKYGVIFVKVSGYREYEDQTFPKFTIVADKLPKKQQQTKVIEEQPVTSQQPLTQSKTLLEEKPRKIDAKQLLSRFKDAIEMGLPLNEKDFNSNLLVEERIFLFKHGYVVRNQELFYFTANAQQLFPQQSTV